MWCGLRRERGREKREWAQSNHSVDACGDVRVEPNGLCNECVLRIIMRGWRDGSAVKSPDCSS